MQFVKKCLSGFILLPIAVSANADTLYDSLSATTAVSAGYNLISGLDFGPLADSFSTGSSDFYLNDVQLALTVNDPTTTGTVTVSLLSDNGTSPGTVLDTLGTINDTALSLYTPATVDFQQSIPIDLTANTRYWIEVSSTDDSSAGWSYTADTTGTGVATEYNSVNYGAPFVSQNTSYTEPYQLQVNGITAVPLPGSAWLFATAFAGLGALRRRADLKLTQA